MPSPGTNRAPDQEEDLAPCTTLGLPSRCPDQSNDTSVVLYGNAAGTLSAQWRLMPNDKERAGASFPPGGSHPRLVLRLIRLHPAGGAEPVAEVALLGEARARSGDCTFPVFPERGRYCAELGLSKLDGAWLMLDRSNALDQVSKPQTDAGRLDTETRQVPAASALQAPRPLPAFSAPADLEPALDLRFPGPAIKVFPLAVPPVATRPTADPQETAGAGVHGAPCLGGHPDPDHRQESLAVRSVRPPVPGGPAVAPIQPAPAAPPSPDVIQIAPIPRLTYGQPAGGIGGVLVEAELRIMGQAPPGTVIDLFGHPYRIGPGGRFQFVLRIDDPTLLRRALELNPPPELALTRDTWNDEQGLS